LLLGTKSNLQHAHACVQAKQPDNLSLNNRMGV
jgi:hypothetical protein